MKSCVFIYQGMSRSHVYPFARECPVTFYTWQPLWIRSGTSGKSIVQASQDNVSLFSYFIFILDCIIGLNIISYFCILLMRLFALFVKSIHLQCQFRRYKSMEQPCYTRPRDAQHLRLRQQNFLIRISIRGLVYGGKYF